MECYFVEYTTTTDSEYLWSTHFQVFLKFCRVDQMGTVGSDFTIFYFGLKKSEFHLQVKVVVYSQLLKNSNFSVKLSIFHYNFSASF